MNSIPQQTVPPQPNAPRWAAAFLLVCWLGITSAMQVVRAEEGLAEILSRAKFDSSDGSASQWHALVASLQRIDTLDVKGRHRFILPDTRARSKIGRAKLQEQLRHVGLLDPLTAHIDQRVQDALAQMEVFAATGDQAAAYRWKWRAEGLRGWIASEKSQGEEWPQAQAWNGIRVARSNENFPLVTWNGGTYSVARTANFSIASQAGDRPTMDMAEACEMALALWRQMFFAYWASEQVVAPKFDVPPHEPFRVVLFRNRDAYVKALRAIEPRIGVSTGYYSPQHRISFFYWDGAKSLPTLVHELTHQFFNESALQQPEFDPDTDPGYWAVEGVALYMESLSMQSIGGSLFIDIGGWDATRLQAGRYRRLHDEYWIPWEEFRDASGVAFRRTDEIAAWYSQACGLTHRWLDGSPEEALLFKNYLQRVYAGQGESFATELAPDDDAVRTAYDRYLMQGWKEELAAGQGRVFLANRREVVLSRCNVKSQDLLVWPTEYRTMDWLDVSHTDVDDSWLIHSGEPAWDIARLNLESTPVTDGALASIAQMASLIELDLTSCAITDSGLAALDKHPGIRRLWLGGTQITDASIELLATLPRLERVVVEGSQITESGWQRLIRKRPHLKK